ncbi:MAG: phosphoribosylglycinamide formyltransferase [Parvularculaceae bacterium]
MAKLRVAVLISGRGSNLAALIEAAKDPAFPAEIVHVISNRADAGGLETARQAGIATSIIEQKTFGKGEPARAAFEHALSKTLKQAGAGLVCLAGFMRILTAGFVGEWYGKLVNIHPSLLPAFKGLDVHQRMLDAGVKLAGCTVHYVSAEMDAGPIIGQAAVPVHAGDDAQALAARILAQEHKLYPECVRRIAAGEVALGSPCPS